MARSNRWRVHITANNGAPDYPGGAAELKMFDGDGVNLCVGGSPLYSSQHGTFTASLAFDGDTNNYGWLTARYTESPCWLGYEFTSSVEVKRIELTGNPSTMTDASGNLGSQPKDFTIQYWTGEMWVDAGDPFTGEVEWVDFETRSFVIADPIAYHVVGQIHGGQRRVYLHRQSDGLIVSQFDTDNDGRYSAQVPNNELFFIRVVDLNGIYRTEIRENLVPIESPV